MRAFAGLLMISAFILLLSTKSQAAPCPPGTTGGPVVGMCIPKCDPDSMYDTRKRKCVPRPATKVCFAPKKFDPKTNTCS
jgi:hypothetical protein